VQTTKKKFEIAESKMNELLAIVDKKGGFEKLTKKENEELAKQSKIVKSYEDVHYSIALP
jgi:hypothetical protein